MNDASKWLVGYIGTWFILSAMSESSSLESLASALAVAIAITATFALGPDAARNLGVA